MRDRFSVLPVAQASDMNHRTVYVVDDNEEVRSSLAFFAASTGFSPKVFASSAKFLADADTLSPGCVLLDVRMPEFDGFQVLERLVERRTVLPAVVMTGHGDVATAVRSMKLGACDFLEKPFQEDIVLEILERVFATLDGTARDIKRVEGIRTRLGRLSNREREVLAGLIQGRANKLIAYDLDISVRTVEMHRAGMMERLGVRTFAEALRMAHESGFTTVLEQARFTAVAA